MSKKICIVSPSLKMGGIERALTVLASYFNAKGYEVSFISCLGGENFYKLDEGIHLVKPKFSNRGGVSKVFFYFRLLFFLRKEVKKIHPDVVLSFGDWFNPLVLLSLKGLDYPVFISDRTSPDYNFNVVTKLGKRILYPMSKGFIAQTQKAADFKKNQFGEALNIKVIPNAIRELRIHQNEKEKIILYVGRFAWEKAPQRAIEAFSKITSTNGWELHMAGDGPLLNEMKELAKSLGITDKIVFHGKVKEIDSLFSKASIYVLPSVLEGFPNALCEALSAGIPSLCFESIPYENIIEDGTNGFIIKNNDIEELSERMKYLMKNKETLEHFSNNAKKIKEELSLNKIGERYLQFLFEK